MSEHTILEQETIVALATASGNGAIAVIRLSGKDAIVITNQVFRGKDLLKQSPLVLDTMETKFKAFEQQYNNRMIENKLIYEIK